MSEKSNGLNGNGNGTHLLTKSAAAEAPAPQIEHEQSTPGMAELIECFREQYDFVIQGDPQLERAFQRLYNMALRRARVITIEGETGTGKELAARWVKEARNDGKPFCAVDCGVLTESLVESALFGHERGSFTSAVEMKKGYCEIAGDGILFMDEINKLPKRGQTALLRALESKDFRRVGGAKPLHLQCQIICASNKNLWDLTRAKDVDGQEKFLEDLYYRLGPITRLPAFKERREEHRREVVKHVGSRLEKEYGTSLVIEPDGMDLFIGQQWSGNIRQLRNVMEVLIYEADASEKIIRMTRASVLAALQEQHVYEETMEAKRNAAFVPNDIDRPLGEVMEQVEKAVLQRALLNNNNSRAQAAKKLKISRVTFYKKMKKHDMADRE